MKKIKMIKELQESINKSLTNQTKSLNLKKCTLRKGSRFLEISTSKIDYWYPKQETFYFRKTLEKK